MPREPYHGFSAFAACSAIARRVAPPGVNHGSRSRSRSWRRACTEPYAVGSREHRETAVRSADGSAHDRTNLV